MAINDFTNQNIQDTYQKVVQTERGKLADGTGSLLPISFDGNNVIISGSLTAQTYVVSESIINVSSGSTIFGNSLDDTHTFTGEISASGDLTISQSLTFGHLANYTDPARINFSSSLITASAIFLRLDNLLISLRACLLLPSM